MVESLHIVRKPNGCCLHHRCHFLTDFINEQQPAIHFSLIANVMLPLLPLADWLWCQIAFYHQSINNKRYIIVVDSMGVQRNLTYLAKFKTIIKHPSHCRKKRIQQQIIFFYLLICIESKWFFTIYRLLVMQYFLYFVTFDIICLFSLFHAIVPTSCNCVILSLSL